MVKNILNGVTLNVFVLIFLTVTLMGGVSLPRLMSLHGVESAYFVVVDYPKSVKSQANENVWNFTLDLTIRNVNCSEDVSGQAWFFLKFYLDGELWWNEYNGSAYKVWRCDRGYMSQRRYGVLLPTWTGPKNYDFKIELHWYHEGISNLEDATCFTISCVLLLNPRHQFVIGYLCVYSFVIVIISLYLATTGRIKISAKTGKSMLWCFVPSKEALSSGIGPNRLYLMIADYSRWLFWQVCAYE